MKKNLGELENLIKYLSSLKIVIIFAFILSGLINFLMLVVPIYSLQVLDRVISSGSLETLLMLSLVVFFAIICLNLVSYIRSLLFIKTADWLHSKVGPILFSHGIGKSSMVARSTDNQDLNDWYNIKSFITGNALTAILDAPWSIIFFTALFFMHHIIGFTCLIGAVILFIVAIINENLTKNKFDASSELMLKSKTQADIAIRNAQIIEAMGMNDNLVKNWHEKNSKAINLQNEAGNYSAIIGSVSKFIRLFLQMLTTGIGAYLVLQNEFTVGAMIASGILTGRALAPFESAIISWKSFISVRKAAARLINSMNIYMSSRHENMSYPDIKGELSVEKLFFAANNVHILKSINFKLEAGTILGVIGPSAAGKSTLAKLLTGVLKPSQGSVRLDNIDVYSWNRNDFGKYIGYLPQDIELFDGSVMQNIARMSEDFDKEAVINAAKFVNIHEMILRLPAAYDTHIGMNGAMISAGQRQRIGLARALYNNPKFVVLDEPNSNLDDAGDYALSLCLQRAKAENITVIVISHRKSIIASVDKLLVLNEGEVKFFGDKNEVLQKLSNQQALAQQNVKLVKNT